ncbi:alpha/beta hydrolase family protein [Monashia sp. NPDC004114]
MNDCRRAVRPLVAALAALAVLLPATACTQSRQAPPPTSSAGSGDTDGIPGDEPASSAPGTSVPTAPGPREPTTKPTNERPPDPASIAALIGSPYSGGDLRLGREGGSTSAYRQYFVTYHSNGLTISGRINIPRGQGPFPAVVLAHGYVDPAEYTNGETMLRERDYLARHGYVTLHIDYRNHAQSSKDPSNDANLRNGYTVDAINAGLALKKAQVVDPERVGIIGRSMGGGVVFNALVARPGLFRAAVAYSPVSSDTVDNFNRWVRRDTSRAGAASQVIARLGTPEAQPSNWRETSPRSYFDRITEPLLIHHGTLDDDCPIEWSRETVAALEDEGKDVEFYVYPGQRHTFTSQWPLSIRRTLAFLDEHMT